jgi:hypothetical protein
MILTMVQFILTGAQMICIQAKQTRTTVETAPATTQSTPPTPKSSHTDLQPAPAPLNFIPLSWNRMRACVAGRAANHNRVTGRLNELKAASVGQTPEAAFLFFVPTAGGRAKAGTCPGGESQVNDYFVSCDVNDGHPGDKYKAAHARVEAVLARLDGTRISFSVWALRSSLDPGALAVMISRQALLEKYDSLTVVPCDFNRVVEINPRHSFPHLSMPRRTVTSEMPLELPTFRRRS